MFFRKTKTDDERITNTENKIYKEMYFIVLIICILSVSIKVYVHGFHTKLIYTEIAILLAQGIYYTYRSVSLGIYSNEVELHDRKSKLSYEKKNLLIGMGVGILLAGSISTRSAILYGDGVENSISTFFLVLFVCFIMYVPFFVLFSLISHSIMKKKSDKAIDKQLKEFD